MITLIKYIMEVITGFVLKY